MNKNDIIKKLFKAVIGIGIIAFIAVLFRFWTLFFVALALLIGAVIWMHILKSKNKKNEAQSEEKRTCSEEKNNQMSIGEQVSMHVRLQYPDAKWIWAQPNSLKRISDGDEVFILLNGAGGYRHAKVIVIDNLVGAIEICQTSEKPKNERGNKSEPTEIKKVKSQVVNYELIAFEWVESHIEGLNERLNDAIGQNVPELILKVDELPVSESWESICEELKRVGLSEVEYTEEGIKIKLMQ